MGKRLSSATAVGVLADVQLCGWRCVSCLPSGIVSSQTGETVSWWTELRCDHKEETCLERAIKYVYVM